MQAEGMRLVQPRPNCVLPPPAEKLIQNPLRKTKLPRHPPAVSAQNPVVLRLIVMFSVIVTGRIVRFRPPGQKMKAIPPPPTNIVDFPS